MGDLPGAASIPLMSHPAFSSRREMEALGRVELPTFGLGNRCSIHLSYRAARRNRLDYLSLPQRGVANWSFLLPNRCAIAERRFPFRHSRRCIGWRGFDNHGWILSSRLPF